MSGVCSKCSNGSFENLTNQLRDADGDVLPVDIADVAEPETAQKVALEPEIVPLKQFVRGGKAKQYLTFGIITLENDSVPE